MSGIDDMTDGIRKIFLAGVGAMATGAEKSQDILDDLVRKGELTVEQGKELNRELKHKAQSATTDASDAVLKNKLRSMTAEERNAWIAKAQKMADEIDNASVKVEVDAEDVTDADDASDAADASAE